MDSMISRMILIIVFLCSLGKILGQQASGGPQYLRQLSHAYPPASADLTGSARQPAALPENDRAGILFSSQRMISTESPGEYLLVTAFPLVSGRVLFAADYLQFYQFRQMQAGIGYAMKLSGALSVGIKMNYYRQSVIGYSPRSFFPVEFGVMYKVTDKFCSGVSAYNIMYAFRRSNTGNPLPLLIALGWSLSLSKEVMLLLTASWQENEYLCFQPSFRILMREKYQFNFGYTSTYNSFFASASYAIRSFILQLGFQFHPQLGMSSGLALEWLWSKR